MNIIQATNEHSHFVKMITKDTIMNIYPHYYPKGAVNFFLAHHNDMNIDQDIRSGYVFLLFDKQLNAVATVTIKENEILRLFVLPQYQKKGYGSELMQFAETKIAKHHQTIRLDASLTAKAIYLNHGYVEIETHVLQTEYGDYLCYDVMEKNIIKS